MYTELLRSFPSISWQVPSMVHAYHSHLWDLSSLEQYFTLGLSILRSSDYHALDTPYQHEASHNWLSIWKKVSGILLKYPPMFLEQDKLSDLQEVATCCKPLWMMERFHCPFCTPSLKLHVLTAGGGWWWCIKVSFILISSHSIRDWPVTYFSPPSRCDSMTSSYIFGLLKGLST